jgi:hypothetical protein
MYIVKGCFIWCFICGPFFVWYSEDGDCVLVFFCGKMCLVDGFLYVFLVMWMGVSSFYPFVGKGRAFGSKYGVPLEWGVVVIDKG